MSSNGALGATFHIARAFQGCSLIAIIGMTANFIAQIVSANSTPPSILIGTIAVVCLPGLLLDMLKSELTNIDLRSGNLLRHNLHPHDR